MNKTEENLRITTPEEYISSLPEERKEPVRKLREIAAKHLPKGFEEVMQYGMITFVVPHSIYPEGYHVNPVDPLMFLSIGNQKGFVGLYHMGIYMDKELTEWFENAYKKLDIGKLDMGKSCVRFKNTKKIPYDLIAELCEKMSVEAYIKIYDKSKIK